MKWGREVLLDQREVDRDEWGAQWPCWLRTRLRCWEVGIRYMKWGVLLNQREVDRDEWGHGGPAG